MKLSEEQKVFIVTRLAMFDPPRKIITAFKEEFGVAIDRPTVRNYDVGNGRRSIARGLVALYNTTRETFLKQAAEIPIAQRSFRLRRLQAIHDDLFDKGNLIAAAGILEQAAKEAGDVFTNTTKVSGNVKHDHEGEIAFKNEENRASLADLIETALRKSAPPGETIQ